MAKYSKKLFRKKRPTLRSLAKRVDKIQGDTEVKYHHAHSSSVTGLPITNALRFDAPRTFLISAPTQGDDSYERIGDTITGTSIRIAGQVYLPGGGAVLGVDGKVRIIVWVNKDPIGAAPVLYGISAVAGAKPPLFLTNGGTPAIWEQYNIVQHCYEHYDVLYDKVINLETNVAAWKSVADVPTSVNPATYFEINIPFRRQVKFKNYLPDVPSSTDGNAVYVTFMTDVATSYLQVEGMTRFGFKDL